MEKGGTTDCTVYVTHTLFPPQLVSTSRTPGHTKHFQTLFLSRSVRLCDCPGLVFPSLVDRRLQVGTWHVIKSQLYFIIISVLSGHLPDRCVLIKGGVVISNEFFLVYFYLTETLDNILKMCSHFRCTCSCLLRECIRESTQLHTVV